MSCTNLLRQAVEQGGKGKFRRDFLWDRVLDGELKSVFRDLHEASALAASALSFFV